MSGALAALALMAVLAACGATTDIGDPGAATTAATGRGVSATPRATSVPVGVVVVPGAKHYGVSDTITVTIRNNTSGTVYAPVRATECSAVALERLTGGTWELVKPCAGGNPHPSVLQIPPGSAFPVDLAANAPSGDAMPRVPTSWPAGTYRAVLTYTTNASEAFSKGAAVYSWMFAIS